METVLQSAFASGSKTQLSPYFEQPKAQRQRKTVPPAVGRVIAELGLRYRPSATTDLEAHAHRLTLLAEDVSDIPLPLLEGAAERWVRQSRFMPTASELRALAGSLNQQGWQQSSGPSQQLREHCAMLNAQHWCRGEWSIIRTEDGSHTVMRGMRQEQSA